MKFCAAIALLVIVGFVASGDALPARKRMVYYQQPAAAEWYAGAPQQRIMYMQYVQPGRTHARSTQAASALVAGETVATGTYLKEADVADVSAEGSQDDGAYLQANKDCNHPESDVPAVAEVEAPAPVEDALSAAGAHGASSLAEAYPDEAPVVQTSVEQAKKPRDYNFAAAEEAAAPAAEEPTAPVEEELPAPAPIAPLAPVPVPVNRYLPSKKKIIVELDQSAEDLEETQAAAIEDEETENAVDDEEDEEELAVPVKPVRKNPVRVPNARRPAAKQPAAPAKPSKKPAPLPAGTFFPIDFGGTNGGAIAIANSFSTGEGGSATSHAIAYGSPDAARARVRPGTSKRRH
ncbi:CG11370 [Drosophila busckii]|uniref:CG11370 n=1 Tax=Drosophila busckii TaxID=30019 RepID=A0A0M4EI74_DROBS|nr:CG11370 [Drosophila busckii]